MALVLIVSVVVPLIKMVLTAPVLTTGAHETMLIELYCAYNLDADSTVLAVPALFLQAWSKNKHQLEREK